MRRILDLVGSEKAGETYIIQRMEDIHDENPDSLKAWSNSKEFDRDRFADIHLGTIWIHNYEEIPTILETCVEGPQDYEQYHRELEREKIEQLRTRNKKIGIAKFNEISLLTSQDISAKILTDHCWIHCGFVLS